MAVVFSQQKGDTLYEIRTAGRSVRMYTNRVLHTQYNPGHAVTGGVWDLLALPALALPQVKRVLMLGVGGGAAMHLLREWCPGVHITGIELNPVHLQLARRFFDLKGRDLTLVQGDARLFVEQYDGEPFDLVMEDIFSGSDGEPDRVFPADNAWCKALGRVVNERGALVMNTVSRKQLRETAFVQDGSVRKHWGAQIGMSMPHYANAVGAFFRQPVTLSDFRMAIRADLKRQRQERAGLLRFNLSLLSPAPEK
jgi:predicted membrane-bound spermidine synthase